MRKNETAITREIIQWVRDNGGYAWHVHGSALQPAGQPDIDGFIEWRGKVCHLKIEVKTPTGVLGRLQEYMLRQYQSAGYVVCVATCIQDVKEALDVATKA